MTEYRIKFQRNSPDWITYRERNSIKVRGNHKKSRLTYSKIKARVNLFISNISVSHFQETLIRTAGLSTGWKSRLKWQPLGCKPQNGTRLQHCVWTSLDVLVGHCHLDKKSGVWPFNSCWCWKRYNWFQNILFVMSNCTPRMPFSAFTFSHKNQPGSRETNVSELRIKQRLFTKSGGRLPAQWFSIRWPISDYFWAT